MSTDSNQKGLAGADGEFDSWLTAEYEPAFTAAVGGADVSEFIRRFWGTPVWVGNDRGLATLVRTDEEMARTFAVTVSRLKAANHDESVILDKRIVVFNEDGAGVDSLWSRRRRDGSEIERTAVHFTLARRPAGIRIVTFETHGTDATNLQAAWPIIAG